MSTGGEGAGREGLREVSAAERGKGGRDLGR